MNPVELPLTKLQKEIMAYLERCRDAAETSHGVNRIWLRRSDDSEHAREVEVALDGLVDRGYLERHAVPGNVAVYRRREPPRVIGDEPVH
jgi:hypothetical protein